MAETGSWWGLKSILEEGRRYWDQWHANPLPSCPECGEPLTLGPDNVRFCRYSGWRETDRRPTD